MSRLVTIPEAERVGRAENGEEYAVDKPYVDISRAHAIYADHNVVIVEMAGPVLWKFTLPDNDRALHWATQLTRLSSR